MTTAIFNALFGLFYANPKFEMDDNLEWSEKLTSKTKIEFEIKRETNSYKMWVCLCFCFIGSYEFLAYKARAYHFVII